MIETRTILPTVARVDLPGILEIAAGTRYATTVRDAREFGPWASESAMPIQRKGRLIVYHHTASELPTGSQWSVVRAFLEQWRRTWPYGVPYNFVVMPKRGFPIYYLNDVDRSWPHTYGYNHSTAIALIGDYQRYDPPPGAVERMLRLADALAVMWGERVPEVQHRDLVATLCPGDKLSPLLPSFGNQRD
jgi:N-acetylmuramoyl-L-alanine amidase-like protein